MRSCREPSPPTDGSEWPEARLAQWANMPVQTLLETELRRALFLMVREGKAAPDGTDALGNPTFKFAQPFKTQR